IDLASNFRSRKDVLHGANYLFRQIFDEHVGEITYDAQAELIYGNTLYEQWPHPEPEPELLIIDCEDSEEAGYEQRSEEHTSELQSRFDLVCRLLLEKKKKISTAI